MAQAGKTFVLPTSLIELQDIEVDAKHRHLLHALQSQQHAIVTGHELLVLQSMLPLRKLERRQKKLTQV